MRLKRLIVSLLKPSDSRQSSRRAGPGHYVRDPSPSSRHQRLVLAREFQAARKDVFQVVLRYCLRWIEEGKGKGHCLARPATGETQGLHLVRVPPAEAVKQCKRGSGGAFPYHSRSA